MNAKQSRTQSQQQGLSKSQAKLIRKTTPSQTNADDWLAPISVDAPCGTNLEFDHDFILLFANAVARQDVQYGAFVDSPEPLNWLEIELACQRLMRRTRDIRVAVLHARCRTRIDGAAGFSQGLELIAQWLCAFADSIHPQIDIETEQADAQEMFEMRVNALQALTDPEGLLADVRQIVLTKSALGRLQVRDVERAFSVPRLSDALATDSVKQQLSELFREQPTTADSFAQARNSLDRIDSWCREQLGDIQPDLSSLQRLVHQLCREEESGEKSSASAQIVSPHDAALGDESACAESTTTFDAVNATAASLVSDGDSDKCSQADLSRGKASLAVAEVQSREMALSRIRSARHWFESYEPSSPVPVLLKRAESLVGRRYAEIAGAIPAQLLEEWDALNGD